ncbi:MAG TPA: apolipoprotein N-acyltransferase [Acidobacteriaceae bacterium]
MRSISPRLWLLAVASALLQALPFAIAGPVPIWRRAFCWIALAPLIVALLARDRIGLALRPAKAALLGYCCGVIWYLANCYWIYQTMYLYGDLPKPVAFGILILFSLYLGLYHALFGWVIGLLHAPAGRLTALLAAPFVWVAVELARARITGFPWDLLGYAQVDNLVLTMLAPFGGVMLLSFVIAAVGTLFAAAWLAENRRLRWGFALAGLVLAAVLQTGVAYRPPVDAATHVATLLQENLVPGAMGRQAESLATLEKYRQFTAWSKAPRTPVRKGTPDIYWLPVPADRKSDLIVWPEAPADFFTQDPVFRAQVGALARETQTPVIAGSVGIDFDPRAEDGYHEFGSAAVFDKNGNYIGRYDKIHRVPFGEYVPYKSLLFFAGKLTAGSGRTEAGTKHTVFHLNGHSVGIFICYESIFGDEVREFVKNGADVLVNISDDGWYGDTGAPWQHLDMERMRAIENRRWILRDTNTGVTTSIDPHGRGIFSTPRHVRAAFAFPFGYRSDITFYTRHGDWFGWLCALVTIAAAAFGFTQRREVH